MIALTAGFQTETEEALIPYRIRESTVAAPRPPLELPREVDPDGARLNVIEAVGDDIADSA
jgi:hypothetical protein